MPQRMPLTAKWPAGRTPGWIADENYQSWRVDI